MKLRAFFPLLMGFLFLGCGNETTINDSSVSDYQWNLPRGVYPPRVPSDNPITEEKVNLGRHLFYDKQLSANQTQSCETCHLQSHGFADTNMVGHGSTGELHDRNPQHLVNAGYYTSYTWANPSLGILERQIFVPITGDDPIELGVVPGKEDEVMARFENNETYKVLFKEAFPDVANPYKIHYVTRALASFIRTLNSFNSPYDKYTRGDTTALTPSQKRGHDLFMSENAECFHCHSGVNFSDSTATEKSFYIDQFFHNIGLYNVDNNGSYPKENEGLYEATMKTDDKGKFRTPGLRNVELTAPYMHDGSMATLEEVIELHSNGGRNITSGANAGNGITNRYKSDLIVAHHFTDQEKEDLVNFLKSLTDEEFINDKSISNPFESN